MSSPCRHQQSNNAPATGRLHFRRLSWFIMAAVGTTSAWAAPIDPSPANPAAVDPGPAASSVEFNSAFSAGTTDVSRFERGNPVLPGTYRADIFLNEVSVDRKDVTFRAVEGSDIAQPCLSYEFFSQLGVDMGKLDPSVATPGNVCMHAADISPDATAKMDVGALRLDLSIPQDSLVKQARGYVNPKMWDQGETAFLMGYNFSAYSVNQNSPKLQTPYGTAVGSDGLPVTVVNNNYYAPDAGNFTANQNGNYMLTPDGAYVPVQHGSYTAPGKTSSNFNNINAFLGLNMGLNVAGWRIRSYETLQWDQSTGRTSWNNVNTTATHDITDWKAQITLGDGYTQGLLFDSSPYRGMTVYSDDRMLPDSQQGYAPVVRGVANTQARVEVRQNGNLLYATTVAPGPFTIDDLNATGYGGDLIVTVFEADGSTHSFVMPYASVPMLLRQGIGRWAITNGQYRSDALRNAKPFYVEGTYQRGINNYLTVYGGVQSTYRALYKSYLGGVAVNTPVGAVGFDITNSHTNFTGADKSLSGYSARVSYSKVLPTAGTTFAVATYRYSNSDFLTLEDAVTRQDIGTSLGTAQSLMSVPRAKQRMQLTLNQALGEGSQFGSLYFSGSRYTYWQDTSSATTYMLGYSHHIGRVNFGLTASRSYSSTPIYRGSRFDNQYGLNVSMPLGNNISAPRFSFDGLHDDVTGSTARASVTGSFGERNEFNYNAGANYTENSYNNNKTTINAGLGWATPYGTLNGSYSHANNYQQASVMASGGVVVHPGGVTLSPSLDLTSPIAIIHAPEAKGARVSGRGKVDGRGYAVVPGLMPYRMNDITIDPAGTSMDVELQATREQTAPRAGAVIPLKFNTVSGRAVMIRATQANGDALPFGADVINEKGDNVGMVGQGGQLFVRGAEDGGTLSVRWGDDAASTCKVSYQLPARDKDAAPNFIQNVDAACR